MVTVLYDAIVFFKLVYLHANLNENKLESSLCQTRNRHSIHASDDKPSKLTSDEIMACALASDERQSVAIVT